MTNYFRINLKSYDKNGSSTFVEHIPCANHYAMCLCVFFLYKNPNLYEGGAIIIIFQGKPVGTREGQYNLPTITES